ncbi:MAG: 50S ribosomal protein L18 [Patescibacteria group bacterium]
MKKEPRNYKLTINKSLKHIEGQIIDMKKGATVIYVSSKNIKDKISKTKMAEVVGEKIAKLAQEKKITECYFDRKKQKYHGRIKALIEAMRKNGVKI